MRKIYTEIKIDIETLEVIEESFYNYDGPVAECKGGSGGGGSSGKVDFPAHMKTAHKDWLDHTGTDSMTYSVVDLMNTAMSGNSPYFGYTPRDADDAIMASGAVITDYTTPYVHLKSFDEWSFDTAFDNYIADDAAFITAAITAHSTQLEDELDNTTLPAFKAGMANINAVMSSTFVLGEARLRNDKVKRVAEADANIRLQRIEQGSRIAIARMAAYAEWRRIITAMAAEFSKLYLAANMEQDESELSNSRKDAVWDLEMYTYGCQVMACISGTASTTTDLPKENKMANALAGAAGGAAAGAALGPWGAAAGGALGLAGSIL